MSLVLATRPSAAVDDCKSSKAADPQLVDLAFEKAIHSGIEISKYFFSGRDTTVGVSDHPVRSK